jgi:hypothetical protein
MSLQKFYQVVSVDGKGKEYLTAKTEQECIEYVESDRFADLMGRVVLTIRPVWSNDDLTD